MPCLKSYDHEGRVKSPAWESKEGRTHLEAPSMLGRSQRCGKFPSPSVCGFSRKEMKTPSQMGPWDSKAKDLAAWTKPVKDLCELYLWQLLPLKSTILYTQLFKLPFQLLGVLVFPNRKPLPRCRGEDKCSLSCCVATWENCFLSEDFHGEAEWLITRHIIITRHHKSFLGQNAHNSRGCVFNGVLGTSNDLCKHLLACYMLSFAMPTPDSSDRMPEKHKGLQSGFQNYLHHLLYH